ncbi:MAG TPA: GAF domain-containing protein [Gemmataceae bacterium]|nr:GAF domain-containing protein [Gemmataceae bacterium]
MESRSRLLLIGPQPEFDGLFRGADVEAVPADPSEVARRLYAEPFAAILATPDVVADLFDQFCRDEFIIEHIDKGLAVLDPAGRITWANAVLRDWCGRNPVGQPFLDALGGVAVAPTDGPLGVSRAVSAAEALALAARGRPVSLRFSRLDHPDQPHLEADVRPVLNTDGSVSRLIALVRNITPEVIQQQKLDALHAAGRELAGLDPDQLSEMNTPSRIELLKQNLRRFIHTLLHYDTIEVRVLDRRTGELKLLLEDGMTREAASRTLYARPTDNGVTGYVAYTGKSYLCPDTATDALYIRGAEGAKSSMTVPLKVHDEVIGTLNVESPRPNGFGPDELQFTELFSREIAAALHTLDLLSAQQECTASQSIEAVNKEIALPIDEVLASASVLLGRSGDDPDAAARLRRILDSARRVKESVSKVGREFAPVLPPPPPGAHVPGNGTYPELLAEGPTPLLGKRVLVVDSDERVRRQAHLLLSRLGAKVETAGTACEGLAMATDNPYDAIFLEVKPADMAGFECYKRFKLARPESVLAMTTGFGYDMAHAIVKARQDGMKYVLFKPFRQDQVVKAVLDTAPATLPRPETAGTA